MFGVTGPRWNNVNNCLTLTFEVCCTYQVKDYDRFNDSFLRRHSCLFPVLRGLLRGYKTPGAYLPEAQRTGRFARKRRRFLVQDRVVVSALQIELVFSQVNGGREIGGRGPGQREDAVQEKGQSFRLSQIFDPLPVPGFQVLQVGQADVVLGDLFLVFGVKLAVDDIGFVDLAHSQFAEVVDEIGQQQRVNRAHLRVLYG